MFVRLAPSQTSSCMLWVAYTSPASLESEGPSLEYRDMHLPQPITTCSVLRRGRGLSAHSSGVRKAFSDRKGLSFDSTTVSSCLNLFPWAKFRRAKGGVKVNVLLDHGDYMPAFVHISEARRHDRMTAHLLKLPAGPRLSPATGPTTTTGCSLNATRH